MKKINYRDLYLKCDVLLLADVFEKFRNSSLKNSRLCPKHYLSAPALSWDEELNITKGELEFISDVYMYLFFKKGMKTRVSHTFKIYSKAENKHFKSYDL